MFKFPKISKFTDTELCEILKTESLDSLSYIIPHNWLSERQYKMLYENGFGK